MKPPTLRLVISVSSSIIKLASKSGAGLLETVMSSVEVTLQPFAVSVTEANLKTIEISKNNTDFEAMQTLAKKVKAGTINTDEIAVLVEFTKQNGGIEYAEQQMAKYSKLCMDYIEANVKEKAVKEALTAYVDYVVQRNY